MSAPRLLKGGCLPSAGRQAAYTSLQPVSMSHLFTLGRERNLHLPLFAPTYPYYQDPTEQMALLCGSKRQ